VRGALAPERLESVLRNGTDTAISVIGETELRRPASAYVAQLVGSDRLNTRLLLHAMVTGHVLFFAACIAELAEIAAPKTFSILENGGRPALRALFARAGLVPALANLLVRLVLHA